MVVGQRITLGKLFPERKWKIINKKWMYLKIKNEKKTSLLSN